MSPPVAPNHGDDRTERLRRAPSERDSPRFRLAHPRPGGSCMFSKMDNLPESIFANPVWHALKTRHRHLAVSAGRACRYPADVAPFAAVAAPSPMALQQLHTLLSPGESVWLVGESYPHVPELGFDETLECLQMVLPDEVTPPAPNLEACALQIVPLSSANAREMVELMTLAFPGFFRIRTPEMGSYYGVRSGISGDGELIAMGGERLMLDGYAEISGVCTHPAHRGQGMAAGLIGQLVRGHRHQGLSSWLHVGTANLHAIKLYLRMGFEVVRKVTLLRITRET